MGMAADIGAAFLLGWRAGVDFTDRKDYAALWETIVELPDPEQCALCSGEERYQAPCLISLSTGQVGEMQVYSYGVTRQDKLDPRETQFSGTLGIQRCAGLTAIRNPDLPMRKVRCVF